VCPVHVAHAAAAKLDDDPVRADRRGLPASPRILRRVAELHLVAAESAPFFWQPRRKQLLSVSRCVRR
jgi:hypothetical protein